MENEIIKICGIAVLCAFSVMILASAQSASGISSVLRVVGIALVLGGVVLLLGDIVTALPSLGIGADAREYIVIMLKGLGIATLCRICSDICRDCGQAALADAVDSAGKLGLVIISLPIVAELIALADELTSKI